MQFETNINCGGCIETVKPYLNAEEGVESWEVDTQNPKKLLTVEGAVDAETVKQAVQNAGFEIKPHKEGFFKKLFG